jgi:hypothetical protein
MASFIPLLAMKSASQLSNALTSQLVILILVSISHGMASCKKWNNRIIKFASFLIILLISVC